MLDGSLEIGRVQTLLISLVNEQEKLNESESERNEPTDADEEGTGKEISQSYDLSGV